MDKKKKLLIVTKKRRKIFNKNGFNVIFFIFHFQVLQSSENRQVFLALIPLNFLSFLAAMEEFVVKNVGLFLLGRQTLVAGMCCQMWHHPLVEVFDVGDVVEKTLKRCLSAGIVEIVTQTHPFAEDVSIFTQQRRIDDSPLVLWLLEMRIRVEEEHLGQLALVEVVGEIFHRVRSEARDVVVFARIQDS